MTGTRDAGSSNDLSDCLVGGYWVLHGPPLFFTGSLAAGTVLTFLLYNNRFAWPFKQVTGIVDSYQKTSAAGGRVLGLLEVPRSGPERPDAIDLDAMSGTVEYEDVSFAYASSDGPSIANVSFAIRDGEMVGFVGPTGAGKSTLMKLLLRFYDVDEGAIYVAGYDVRDLTPESLRRGIGYVGQDPCLFDATVGENIAYSAPDATDAAVERAAHLVWAESACSSVGCTYDPIIAEDPRWFIITDNPE